jgi:hypothetical protein
MFVDGSRSDVSSTAWSGVRPFLRVALCDLPVEASESVLTSHDHLRNWPMPVIGSACLTPTPRPAT